MRPAALVLRPEPGNAATRARLDAAGIDAVALPLFEARALPWTPPDPSGFDALLLTSASAVRLGGDGLRALAGLPVLAVGTATAAAARNAGLTVTLTGTRDAAHVLAGSRFRHPLHLAGREHHPTGAATIIVYATDLRPVAAGALASAIGRTSLVLLHSPRAARTFAAVVDEHGIARRDVALACLSPAIAAAAGSGWGSAASAADPHDDALVALARRRLTGGSGAEISGA